jgi:uncharacterized YccA/Bax inhibitor family protein
MGNLRSSNPAFNEKILKGQYYSATSDRAFMTVSGAINKTGFLTLILVCSAAYSWHAENPMLLWAGIIGGMIAALVTIFKPAWSPVSAPLYAVLEGLFIGAVSVRYAELYSGIIPKAVLLTFTILMTMLFAYRLKIIRATAKFRAGILIATGGIFFFYLTTMLLRFFGVDTSMFFSGGLMGIGISLVIVVIASLNLILDFDFIEKGAESSLPRYFEWYAGFGIMVTLVWLYMEILRLLSFFSGND